jgi:putative glutamine amidotransferase
VAPECPARGAIAPARAGTVGGMTRPVVGLVGALEQARWSVWDQQAVLVNRSYVDAIHRAGGLAVVLPPVATFPGPPGELLARVDAVVLAGGADIDPASYGAEPHPETRGTVPERDAYELAVTHAALDRGLPLLGICRGMQLLNIARGGTLRQHLPEEFGHHEHRRALGSFDDADHDVRLEPGSLAARAAGETHHATKSHHHQGVKRLGADLRVSGWSELDGLPEAIELPDGWVLGVQWHPEVDERSRVLAALIDEARERVARPAPRRRRPARVAASSRR